MGNPLKGEVAFEVSGVTYTLILNIDALVRLEDQFDKSMTQLMLTLQATQRIGLVRAMFFQGLKAKHPDIDLVEAGELVGALGVDVACELLAKAIKLSFGDKSDSDAGGAAAGATGGPLETGAGTGPAS